jgi:GNAT superfamily N-acetyltransferase
VAVAELETRPVGPDDLADLAVLFEGQRSTRHCWCTAFCESRRRFAVGWVTGGNRRQFETMARTGGTPMGILATSSGKPAGWCACGPRSRYTVADGGRSRILRDRDPAEDDAVWLLPCLFVRVDLRGHGLTRTLIRAACDLARREGAAAIEGWPVTGSGRRSADAFLGRQRVFEELGFRCVWRPAAGRVVMRLELHGQRRSGPGTGRTT